MAIEDDQLIGLGPWRGLDTVSRETDVPADRLRQADNVAITKNGKVERRVGLTDRKTTTSSGGLYAWNGELIYVDNGSLVRCEVDSYSTNVLATVDNSLEMSYAEAPGRLYYCNGTNSGCIRSDWTVTTWGVPSPPRQPTLSATTGGSLQAGKYQVAVTFVDVYGEEGGTGPGEPITITSGQAIQLSNIPQSSDAAYFRVYLTPQNGDDFLWQQDVAMGTTSLVIYSVYRSDTVLETQFCAPMRNGTIARFWRGRIYVVAGKGIVYSEPLREGLYRPLDNYLPPRREDIVVLEPVEDGLWVVTTDHIWFYAGSEPDSIVPTHIAARGGVRGTGRTVDARLFNINAPGDIAYWFGATGGVLGLPDGQIQPVYEDIVAVDEYLKGASAVYEHEGLRQVITAMSGKKVDSKFKVTDTISAEVRKGNTKRLRDRFILSDTITSEVS